MSGNVWGYVLVGFAVGFGAGWFVNELSSTEDFVMIDNGQVNVTTDVPGNVTTVLVDSVGFKQGDIVTLNIEPRGETPLLFDCLGENGFLDLEEMRIDEAWASPSEHVYEYSPYAPFFVYLTDEEQNGRTLRLRYAGDHWELDR